MKENRRRLFAGMPRHYRKEDIRYATVLFSIENPTANIESEFNDQTVEPYVCKYSGDDGRIRSLRLDTCWAEITDQYGYSLKINDYSVFNQYLSK